MRRAMGWRRRRAEERGTGDETGGVRIVVDLTESAAAAASVPPPPTPEQIAARDALLARRREEAHRREAERELRDLRRRHWSAQRIFEESHLGIDFWEHPLADPYAVLGLLPGASLQEASAARRRIARQCHPDLAGTQELGADAATRMAAANAAYERLRRALRPVG